ncbi:hypothetical protein, partial [Mycobacteroides abscessus]|uniref:hypothetical protein n=1 Tax=Mycobacteroides abscessus TaxID=36809 RepID=UPI000AF53967
MAIELALPGGPISQRIWQRPRRRLRYRAQNFSTEDIPMRDRGLRELVQYEPDGAITVGVVRQEPQRLGTE